MEPAHTLAKKLLPVEITRLELCGGFITAVVENDWSAHTITAVGIYRRHVWPLNAVVFEMLVERFDTHCAHPLRNKITDGIVHHRRDDCGLESKTIRKVRRTVEFAAADMDVAMGRLAKWDDAGIKPVDQRAERQEIQGAAFGYI